MKPISEKSPITLGLACTFVGGLAAVVAWALATFATIPYVDAKFKESNEQSAAIIRSIDDVKSTVKVIDQRTWEMNGRRAPLPTNLERENE